MANEGVKTAGNLLSLRHDPYMFHQVRPCTHGWVGSTDMTYLMGGWRVGAQGNYRVWPWRDPVDGVVKNFSLISLWLRYVAMVLTHAHAHTRVPRVQFYAASDEGGV